MKLRLSKRLSREELSEREKERQKRYNGEHCSGINHHPKEAFAGPNKLEVHEIIAESPAATSSG
jgi:hypothetical protein